MIDYVYIETTNYCNLSCSFCNRDAVIGKLKHMNLTEFEMILETIKDNPIREAKLMGMGEPFFHPNFDKICQKFKEYFPNSNLISATNCQYTPNKNFENCLKHIDLLYLSIDGYKENYEKFRKPSKWPKLISFLDHLSSIDKHNCKLAINYVVNPDNIVDIQKIFDEIFLYYKLDDFRLNIAQSWSQDQFAMLNYTDEQIQYLKFNWKKYIKGKSKWDYNDCFWINTGLYVTVDGRVLMCCMNTEEKGFGNIFFNDLKDIRNSSKFVNVVNGCKKNNPTDHCKTCSYKELTTILTRIGI